MSTMPVRRIAPGTRVRWQDGHRTAEGVVVACEMPSAIGDWVRVVETVTVEVPHNMFPEREVEVIDGDEAAAPCGA